MNHIFLDIETFYSSDYTLKKQSPVEYAMDQRFQLIGVSAVINNLPGIWIDGPEFAAWAAQVDWKNCFVVTHNALFDMAVLKWRFNIEPALVGDTLAMARAWIMPQTGAVSLKACAHHYGLPPKGDTIFRMSGIDYHSLRTVPTLYDEFVAYGIHDSDLCRAIFFKMLAEGFPPAQLELIDMQIKMCTEPKLVFDDMLLAEYLAEVRAEKESLILQAGEFNGESFLSNEKFAMLLQKAGAEPPRKVSPTTGLETWDFSKKSKAFMDLTEHEDPHVQNLMAARLNLRSTLEETRCESFLRISRLDWQNQRPKTAPIPLRFSGARTHRFSGDWRLNMQNLGRRSKLRNALRAPEGHSILSVDLSQIEARIVAVLAGQDDLVEAFRQGRDVYSEFASDLFGYSVSKALVTERFIGKTATLQLGYGAGWASFQTQVRTNSPDALELDENECVRIVNFYRKKNRKIKQLWGLMENWLPYMASGQDFDWGPLRIRGKEIYLPNGMRLSYRGLAQDDKFGRMRWVYFNGGKLPIGIYGAKITENVTQALAFIVIMEGARRIKHKSGGKLMPVHQIHDELLYCVPTEWVPHLIPVILSELTIPPSWLPAIPLAAEAKSGPSYGEAEGA